MDHRDILYVYQTCFQTPEGEFMRRSFYMRIFFLLFIILVFPAVSDAVPAFARKYETSCQTCHVAFPMLNPFGQAFRNNGYRMPEGDQQLSREPMIPLGAEPWKKLWPHAVWPGKIPRWFPLALKVDFAFRQATTGTPEVRTDMAFPDHLDLFVAGNLGGPFSYFINLALLHHGEFGGLERAFIQLHPLRHSLLLNIRIGAIDVRAVPYPIHTSLIQKATFFASGVIDLTALARGFVGLQMPDDVTQFMPGATQRGLELWGVQALPSLGLEWALGIVNGNGLGGEAEPNSDAQDDLMAPFEPLDNNNAKDIYGRIRLKIGGFPIDGRVARKTKEKPASVPQLMSWQDTALWVGASFYVGKQPTRYGGEERIRRYGVDGILWWKNIRLFGSYWWGSNWNDRVLDVGFFNGFRLPADVLEPDHRLQMNARLYVVEGNIIVYPWLIAAVRWEKISIASVFVRHGNETTAIPEPAGPARWIPHVTALVRANVKFIVEGVFYTTDRYHALNMIETRLVFAF